MKLWSDLPWYKRAFLRCLPLHISVDMEMKSGTAYLSYYKWRGKIYVVDKIFLKRDS